MQRPEIAGILNTIEEENFLRPTLIASGRGTVVVVLEGTQEIQTLLAERDASLPLMRARYRERDSEMTDEVRLVYFVIFGLARDGQMLSDISSYLKRVLRYPASVLMSPWHPFMHGADALELITGGQIRAPRTDGSVKQFDQFLTEVENWTKTHLKSSHQQP